MENKKELTTEEFAEDEVKQLDNFAKDLTKLFEKHGISEYLLCVVHPASPEEPLVKYNDEYEGAKLAARTHKALRTQVLNKIS